MSARRPPSPGNVSVTSSSPGGRAASNASSGRSRKTTNTKFDGMSVNEVIEFVEKTHLPWDSAIKEMARVEAKKQQLDETRSNASTVSCYSIAKSVTSNATSASRRGRLGMLPLRGDTKPVSDTADLSGIISVHGGLAGAASTSGRLPPPIAGPPSLAKYTHNFGAQQQQQQESPLQMHPGSAGPAGKQPFGGSVVARSASANSTASRGSLQQRSPAAMNLPVSNNSVMSTASNNNNNSNRAPQRPGKLTTTAKPSSSKGNASSNNNTMGLSVSGAPAFQFVVAGSNSGMPQSVQQQQQHQSSTRGAGLNLPKLQGVGAPQPPPVMQAARPGSLRTTSKPRK